MTGEAFFLSYSWAEMYSTIYAFYDQNFRSSKFIDCNTGTIAFSLIPNMPIFVHSCHVFQQKLEISSKPDFYDMQGDENLFYLLEWPYR